MQLSPLIVDNASEKSAVLEHAVSDLISLCDSSTVSVSSAENTQSEIHKINDESPSPSSSSTSTESETSTSSTPSPPNSPPILDTAESKFLGRGCRKRKQPTKLVDYVTTLLHEPYPSATLYPLDNYLSSARFSKNYQAYLFAITYAVEPLSYKETIEDENWRFAVGDEIVALDEAGTWTVVDLPPGKKALGYKWMFRLKFKADGNLERHKARLAILGNNQTEGVDYIETFAPVAKMVTVHAFLQHAASLDWEIHQMDVQNAFLHGDLDEEVYMQFSPGFRTNDKTRFVSYINLSTA